MLESRSNGIMHIVAFLGAIILTSPMASAQSFTERFSDWPVETKIRGKVIGCFEESRFESLLSNQVFRGVKDVVIMNANDDADRVMAKVMAHYESVRFLDELDPSTQLGRDTLMIWVGSSERPSSNDWNVAKRRLVNHISDGGIVCVVGQDTRYLGKWAVSNDDGRNLRLVDGWNLMPDTILAIPSSDPTQRDHLRSIMEPSKKCVLLETDSTSSVILVGRKLAVHGKGTLTCYLPPGPHHPAREQTITEPDGSKPIESYLMDLTEWRRDAIDRTLELFPPASREIPHVSNGTLMIVGGGGLPKGLMQSFVDAAGGVDAKLVYVPCAEEEDMSRDTSTLVTWKNMGVGTCSLLHTKDRIKANEDEAFFAPLKTATGIWFGGGRQWNFADSYYGTTTHKLMKEVLARGGVIGGSSAGASIQGQYLARATPIDNVKIMAPGYERGGLGFLSGVAIDQHFSQRGRQKDLRTLVKRYPQLLGIGIDEGTAIIVKKSQAEIVGKGNVFFYTFQDSHQALEEQSYGEGVVMNLETMTPVR